MIIVPAAAAAIQPAPASQKPVSVKKQDSGEHKDGLPGWTWWLAAVLLALPGGLLAWFMTKTADPRKALYMLLTGIGITVVYAGIIVLVILLPSTSSPGGTIVYSQFRDGSWQLNMMRPDGKDTGLVTISDNVNKYYNIQPSWCTATRKFAFYTNRDGNCEIYSMDEDAGNQVNLTGINYWDGSPDWSPDGKTIVFASNRDGNTEIYSMAADGSNVLRLTVSKPADERPKWSPDGKTIVFNTDRDGNHEIYVMDPDGGNQRRLTTNEAWDGHARWSTDSRKIVFSSERDGNPEIYVMNADGSDQKRITFNSAKDYGPHFSPDGTKIVYYSNLDGDNDLYIMNPDGGNQTRLTDTKGNEDTPLWIASTLKVPASETPPPVYSKLISSTATSDNKSNCVKDYLYYTKFTAAKTGTVKIIKVFSTKAGNIKAAIYEHDASKDLPSNKLVSNDIPTECAANQWNNIQVTDTPVKAGTVYWLVFDTDTSGVVVVDPGNARILFKKAAFQDYAFPQTTESGMKLHAKRDVSIAAWGIEVEDENK